MPFIHKVLFSHDGFAMFVKCIQTRDQLIYVTDANMVYTAVINPTKMIPNNHNAAD